MRAHWMCLALAAVATAFPSTAPAAPSKCSSADAKRAEEQSSGIRDWNVLYRAYKRYAPCDDAGVSEGYSEAVSQLLSRKWPVVTRFGVLAREDPEFRGFVVRHIDDTVPAGTLASIRRNATERCPTGLQSICREIAAAAHP